MKVKILCIATLFIALTQTSSFAQKEEMSDSARMLAERIKVEGNQSILDAGELGDKSLVPYLRTLASKGSP